ncbi:hypothetical protein GBA52_025818 [Prunus armeniaca]|nr:hypothetical protein GBA52_025818 [Prunus armeniaca]
MAAVIFPSPPPRAKEAVEFYEVVFGAQTIQHSSRPVAVGGFVFFSILVSASGFFPKTNEEIQRHRAAKLLLLDNATLPAVKFHYVTAAGAARKYETTGPLDSVVVFSDSMDSLTPDFIHTMEEERLEADHHVQQGSFARGTRKV